MADKIAGNGQREESGFLGELASSLPDILSNVMEGYIAAQGGDISRTPTYRAREAKQKASEAAAKAAREQKKILDERAYDREKTLSERIYEQGQKIDDRKFEFGMEKWKLDQQKAADELKRQQKVEDDTTAFNRKIEENKIGAKLDVIKNRASGSDAKGIASESYKTFLDELSNWEGLRDQGVPEDRLPPKPVFEMPASAAIGGFEQSRASLDQAGQAKIDNVTKALEEIDNLQIEDPVRKAEMIEKVVANGEQIVQRHTVPEVVFDDPSSVYPLPFGAVGIVQRSADGSIRREVQNLKNWTDSSADRELPNNFPPPAEEPKKTPQQMRAESPLLLSLAEQRLKTQLEDRQQKFEEGTAAFNEAQANIDTGMANLLASDKFEYRNTVTFDRREKIRSRVMDNLRLRKLEANPDQVDALVDIEIDKEYERSVTRRDNDIVPTLAQLYEEQGGSVDLRRRAAEKILGIPLAVGANPTNEEVTAAIEEKLARGELREDDLRDEILSQLEGTQETKREVQKRDKQNRAKRNIQWWKEEIEENPEMYEGLERNSLGEVVFDSHGIPKIGIKKPEQPSMSKEAQAEFLSDLGILARRPTKFSTKTPVPSASEVSKERSALRKDQEPAQQQDIEMPKAVTPVEEMDAGGSPPQQKQQEKKAEEQAAPIGKLSLDGPVLKLYGNGQEPFKNYIRSIEDLNFKIANPTEELSGALDRLRSTLKEKKGYDISSEAFESERLAMMVDPVLVAQFERTGRSADPAASATDSVTKAIQEGDRSHWSMMPDDVKKALLNQETWWMTGDEETDRAWLSASQDGARYFSVDGRLKKKKGGFYDQGNDLLDNLVEKSMLGAPTRLLGEAFGVDNAINNERFQNFLTEMGGRFNEAFTFSPGQRRKLDDVEAQEKIRGVSEYIKSKPEREAERGREVQDALIELGIRPDSA
jgi:hypothetical protein